MELAHHSSSRLDSLISNNTVVKPQVLATMVEVAGPTRIFALTRAP